MANVKEFLKLTENDAGLHERLEKLSANGGMDDMLALAKEYGFAFTAEELEEGVYADLREAAMAGARKGALSDEELEKVSGGTLAEFCAAYPTTPGCLILKPVKRGKDRPLAPCQKYDYD